jgi:ankyrin repeat protein
MRAGAPADARDREDRTPLMIAREARTFAGVEALIAAGADVNLTGDRLARTPLMHAASAGNVPLMKLLIGRGARVDGRDRKRWSAIRIAHGEGRSPAAVEVLTAAGANASDLRDAELVAAYESGDTRRSRNCSDRKLTRRRPRRVARRCFPMRFGIAKIRSRCC